MRILVFAHLKGVVGASEIDLPVGAVDFEGLWRALIAAHPGLERFRRSIRLAKNSEYVGAEATFDDRDEVALIPPVSGG
ncbi:MAG: MoaD/ThiS family protein [Limisphaerales bacterium]